ncbi:hypothetical protein ACFVUB_34540 [Streptomyces niveus]|uniref:hypothetical protein n=1 Tax=Streptomyces niveus TaxID=193462 RepID=UPI0036DC1F3C
MVWPATTAEASDLLGAVAPAAEAVAYALNREIEAADPRHTTAHLSAERIASHLAQRWGLPEGCSRAVLDATARDRAFRDFASAVEVTRAFYLSARAVVVTAPSASLAACGARQSPRT